MEHLQPIWCLSPFPPWFSPLRLTDDSTILFGRWTSSNCDETCSFFSSLSFFSSNFFGPLLFLGLTKTGKKPSGYFTIQNPNCLGQGSIISLSPTSRNAAIVDVAGGRTTRGRAAALGGHNLAVHGPQEQHEA